MAYINGKKILQVVKTEFIPAVYQEKTITPQTFTPEVVADQGYAALSKVKLDGILVDPHESYTSTTDSTIAYQKSVPAGALKYASIDTLGGMSYKSENLLALSDVAETTTNGITYSISNGTINVGDSANANLTITLSSLTYFNGTYTLKNFGSQTLSNSVYFVFLLNGEWSNVVAVRSDSGTIILNGNYIYGVAITSGTSVSGTIKPMLVSGSTAPTTYQPYFEGIRNTIITSVISKDSNDNTLATGDIPSEILALDGIGWGISQTVCNYTSFVVKRFTKKVNRVDLGTLDYQMTTGNRFYALLPSELGFKAITVSEIYNALCSIYNITSRSNVESANMNLSISLGTAQGDTNSYINIVNTSYATPQAFKTAMAGKYLYYELAEPIETDISQYIDDINFIEVASGGTTTYTNQYEQAVPSDITYLVEVE